jgi:cardiolipin synthase
MTCSPSLGTTNAERFFFLAIASARERIYIANAYFVPTRDLRWLLMNAADRGVDVRVLTPGVHSDQPVVWHASRALYKRLLSAGVRIWEYRPGMMHAKTFVADSCWATIGTFNFDNRSMKLNDEVALIVRDEGVARRLEESFLADLAHADEVQAETLERLGTSERIKGRLARFASPVL